VVGGAAFSVPLIVVAGGVASVSHHPPARGGGKWAAFSVPPGQGAVGQQGGGSSPTGEAALREELGDSSSATKMTWGTRTDMWSELKVEDTACRTEPPTPDPDAKASDEARLSFTCRSKDEEERGAARRWGRVARSGAGEGPVRLARGGRSSRSCVEEARERRRGWLRPGRRRGCTMEKNIWRAHDQWVSAPFYKTGPI
jgi:hypothetical protein